jgi:hypothetical protein
MEMPKELIVRYRVNVQPGNILQFVAGLPDDRFEVADGQQQRFHVRNR